MPDATTAIRWTMERAASEFGLDAKTLRKRLITESIEPGKDGKYSTAQITRCVFGDLDAEKLRKAKADADRAEVEAAESLGEVILKTEADFIWADAALETRKTVEAAEYLNTKQKAALLAELAKIKLQS